MVSRAKVAVQIMRHLCTCPEHGYSWPGRYGTSGYCSVKTDAGTIKVKKGDRDCSSACCEAWELALEGTPYEGKITKFHTTYDMREMFVNSGLFAWKNMNFNASPGDVYLDEDQHTAMCIQNDSKADLLGEFSISEHGTTDGEPGDQTGHESSIHDYYEAWDGILHYNGKADGDAKPATPAKTQPRYRVCVGKEWLDEMRGKVDAGGSSDTYAGILGKPITYLACNAKKYRVKVKTKAGTKWLPWVTKYDYHDLDYGCAGDGHKIVGVEISDNTVKFRVHVQGGEWLPAVTCKATGNGKPIDAVRMVRV